MQNLGPHLKPTETKSAAQQTHKVIHMNSKFETHPRTKVFNKGAKG